MKNTFFLLLLFSSLSYSQVTDQNNKSAVDVNGDELSGFISIPSLGVNGVHFLNNTGTIFDNDGFPLLYTHTHNNNKILQIGTDDGPNTEIRFMTPYSYNAFTLKNNGFVGIGTTNPQYKLDVNGEVRFSNLLTLGLSGAGIKFIDSHLNQGVYIGDLTGNDIPVYINAFSDLSAIELTESELSFKTDNLIAMHINNAQNVGIGTTNPNEKLSVNGKIHAKGVRVDLTGWPDYVFDENYILVSLDEVENYIKVNGHLKDIPNAKDVEKNGIELGEMNKLLLQKIEELTLYVIDLKKEIELLKNKN